MLKAGPLFGEFSGGITYLYTFNKFNWEIDQFSRYMSTTALVAVIGQTFVVPLVRASQGEICLNLAPLYRLKVVKLFMEFFSAVRTLILGHVMTIHATYWCMKI